MNFPSFFATNLNSLNHISKWLLQFFRKELDLPEKLAFSGWFWQFEGNKWMRQKNPGIIEHLALLSIKHGVYVSELFGALVEAREQRHSICHTLAVEYRGSVKKEAIFLITKEYAIIGQFRVAEEFLLRKDIRFENWMNTDKIRRQMEKQKQEMQFTLVNDLRHGMRKVNLEAEVLETSTPSRIYTQYGNSATITNALIADQTGSVKLCLWNEQEPVVRTGDTVQIKNASVLMYKGERQLHLGKSGTVSVLNHTK